ncbi:MAG TPA: hypothetical protein VGP72_28465 [Planctomycetota bacterium]
MKQRKDRGIALIMVAGVLAVLAAMATGFFVLMLMQTNSAVRYGDSVRAYMLGQGGINVAIAKLRARAFQDTEDPSAAWYTWDWMNGGRRCISFPDSDLLHNGVDDDMDGRIDNPEEALAFPKDPTKAPKGYSGALGNSANANMALDGPSDRYLVQIEDAASKININAGENLAVILDNLCRVIGPPLVPANLDALQPRRWCQEAGDYANIAKLFDTPVNRMDLVGNRDVCFTLTNESDVIQDPLPGKPALTTGTGRPMRDPTNKKLALYGDGYAIAGYRARHGAFQNIEDVKNALTYVERSVPANSTPDDPLERLEIEVKFAAIRDYITTHSWVDTNTVCVGKFEWVHYDTTSGVKTIAIDRDKSWIIDDLVNDPMNTRGSLRGCYLSIIQGHGAGQLRRIRTNGIDWIEVDPPRAGIPAFSVTPGPISSYMIISNEEAQLMDINFRPASNYPDSPPAAGTTTFPKTNPADGTLINNPKIDYTKYPLCIHRAPVNVNTASDKVLAALFLGINVQHGHPLSVGMDVDAQATHDLWKKDDIHKVEPYVLTPAGLKRIPATSGKIVLNRTWNANIAAHQVVPPPVDYDVQYLNRYNTLGLVDYAQQTVGGARLPGTMTEAHELAYRIIMARQIDRCAVQRKYINLVTGAPSSNPKDGPLRGPFRCWDDLYFKVVKPWDDQRVKGGWKDNNGNNYMDEGDDFRCSPRAAMIMAQFNPNTDILKFNPNIEWIDRWGRNFTAQEPVMVFTNAAPPGDGVFRVDVPAADPIKSTSGPLYTCVVDPNATSWSGKAPPIASGRKDSTGRFIDGAYITRSFRNKSTEMIDKTDLNRSTTEFSFDSNGVFEITSTGQVAKASQKLAERKFQALVKVYDVWRETTQAQFVQGTISKAAGDRKSKGSTDLRCTGQLARDASGLVERKGLVTLPEPLLPLKTRIVNIDGQFNPRNKEVVSVLAAGNDPLNALGTPLAAAKPRSNPYDQGALPIQVPDVLANLVLPARYDGQIVLATNTSGYDNSDGGDKDTFLATFDGDLDTADCEGNGREQAKWPYSAMPDGAGSYTYTGKGYERRCVPCIGLLGRINDEFVASDPGLPLCDGKTPYNDYASQDRVRWVYPFFGLSAALMPLKLGNDSEQPAYWNNVTLSMGALRTDGAYLSAPGVSGNTATLKYTFSANGSSHTKLNFQPDSPDGNCVTMWAKTAWHHDDAHNHEFFNPGNESLVGQCAGGWFQKMGQYKWTAAIGSTMLNGTIISGGIGHCGNRFELNDLFTLMPYQNGSGYGSGIHGGYAGVLSTAPKPETAGYYVQPFRWSFLGYRSHYLTKAPMTEPTAIGPKGHLVHVADWQNSSNYEIPRYYVRPFIDNALYPESKENWDNGNDSLAVRLRWSHHGFQGWNGNEAPGTSTPTQGLAPNTVGDALGTGPNPQADSGGFRYGEGQFAKWTWADPYGAFAPDRTFGMNNLNNGNPVYNQPFDRTNPAGSCALNWHYRQMPEDGTYAVIDELKISSRDRVMVDGASDWSDKDRVSREMHTSRYYLPRQPNSRQDPSSGGPPTFTSQTMLQSLKGFDKVKDTQQVTVARVSWTVFTPRFMCEYMKPGTSNFKMDANLTHFKDASAPQTTIQVPIKGPFNYAIYNDDGVQGMDANPPDPNTLESPYSVNRPAPWNYPKGVEQASRGVEIELLQDQGSGAPIVLAGKTFIDPSALNALGTSDLPVMTRASWLRYRVRFMYPVDKLCDPNGGQNLQNKPFIDPEKQYLLDTPVFDDISVTVFMPSRIFEFREVIE